MANMASSLLCTFMRAGKLTVESAIQELSDYEVLVLNLHAVHKRTGIGREFLNALRREHIRVHIQYPLRDALPFWRRMSAEGLIADNPDALPTWEDFLNGIESEMTWEEE
jgi:hypothetical protein